MPFKNYTRGPMFVTASFLVRLSACSVDTSRCEAHCV